MSAAAARRPFLDLAPASIADGVLRLPGSKSISLRALLLAALADGTTRLDGVLESEDTEVMFSALAELGIRATRCAADSDDGSTRPSTDSWLIEGCGGNFSVRQANLFVGLSGVSTRTLVAALAIAGGDYRIDGVPRMRERPIGDLVDALRAIGARIDYEGAEGFPPLRIGTGMMRLDRTVPIRGDVSSQFLTGLLQALPMTGRGATVRIEGELISKPYVDMTVALMRRFGVAVERDGYRRFTIAAEARYTSPGTFVIEGDASNASYFLAAGAIAATDGRRVRIEGVGRDSIQGDVAFAGALAQMGATVDCSPSSIGCARNGALHGIDIDCTAIPDAAMTLAVVALFADGPTLLRGIGSWRVKETDRIAAMAAELAKIGARVEAGDDWLRVEPTSTPHPAAIDTYDDHRMAMCFSLASLLGVPIRIHDPQCVAKTYPGYFDDFARIVR